MYRLMKNLAILFLLIALIVSCESESSTEESPDTANISDSSAFDVLDVSAPPLDTRGTGAQEVAVPEPTPEPEPEPEPGLEPGYISAKFVSASYTMGGSYGSFRHFTRPQYSFSDFDLCSCGGACNPTWQSDCKELYYNPSTRQVKYLLEGEESYEYRSLGNPYTCQKYEPLN